VDPIAATSIAAGPSAAAVDPAPAASMAAATPEPLAAPAGPPLADSPPVLLLRRELSSGAALERLIEPSGDIVVHMVTPAGTVDSCEKVGTLFALPLLEQTFVAGGEVVHVARDESGAIVRYVVRADGEPRAVAVVAPTGFR
jgi:hypothetical protein